MFPRPHPRLFLPALRADLDRRLGSSPAWKKMRDWCDEHKRPEVQVWWPDQGADNDHDRIASGYQGADYFAAITNLALCWQMTHDHGYADKGIDVLIHMSEPAGPHAPSPLRDEGYGIRFYGVGMALGYDWLYQALSAEQKKRIYTALDRWLDAYDEGGFAREHPVGNYFAGFYAAKALAALATEGDDPRSPAIWDDWRTRMHGQMVQPYYARHLRGGGWPEGWNYGPLATVNMALPVLAARTAKGLDLLPGFRFPVEQAENLMYHTWPTRRTVDDRGAQYASENPSGAAPGVFTVLAGLLVAWHDPLAPQFHRYAREVRTSVTRGGQGDRGGPGDAPALWEDFLFWDDQAPEADYRGRPLSYLSPGLGTVAMRSSWKEDAVWATFTSGTYNTNAEAGEMYFDQGSLAVVRGGRPLLVNSVAALLRNSPGTNDGDANGDLIYEDLFGDHDAHPDQKNRTIFNIFYARGPQFGQIPVDPDEGHTRIDRFEDVGAYLLVRGTHLEDMYRASPGGRLVESWTRQVTYLRPALFVIEDWTRVSKGCPDAWLAFHVDAAPVAAGGPAGAGGKPGAASGPATEGRWDIGTGARFSGSLTPVFPRGGKVTAVDVFGKHKVWRIEVRAPDAGVEQRWLTVVDAAATPGQAVRPSALSKFDGSVQAGGMLGVLVPGRPSQVVLSPVGHEPDGEIRYAVPSGPTVHVVNGLRAGQGYSVAFAAGGGRTSVRITASGDRRASPAGVLSFHSD
jgi:hypothetical protein